MIPAIVQGVPAGHGYGPARDTRFGAARAVALKVKERCATHDEANFSWDVLDGLLRLSIKLLLVFFAMRGRRIYGPVLIWPGPGIAVRVAW